MSGRERGCDGGAPGDADRAPAPAFATHAREVLLAIQASSDTGGTVHVSPYEPVTARRFQ